MPRFIIELPLSEIDTFYEFLLGSPIMQSYRKIGNSFIVSISESSLEDHELFLAKLGGLFITLQLQVLCEAKCVNGTDCLNTAKQGIFCWKHKTDK